LEFNIRRKAANFKPAFVTGITRVGFVASWHMPNDPADVR
jgi:hypothetical protein